MDYDYAITKNTLDCSRGQQYMIVIEVILMKINDAVKKTGLTKKAIRYHVEKGLVFPKLNLTNGYKDYSQENIEDLQMIAFLRSIDMPVTLIEEYLNFTERREGVLNRHLCNLNNKINELEAAKEAIRTV